MNKTEIEEKLTELLALNVEDKDKNHRQKKGCVIKLDGVWGCGKTHLWKKFQEEYEKDNKTKKHIIYVSLFNKSSLNHITEYILCQLSVRKKISKKIGKNLDWLSKWTLIKPSTVLSSLEKTTFEDIIICFDDFERVSDKISIRELFGLFSQLKEDQHCKIVMILNEGKIKDDEFSTYKEKIIDRELFYDPTPEDTFSIAKEIYYDSHNHINKIIDDSIQNLILTCLKDLQECNLLINNIRIQLQLFYIIEDLLNILFPDKKDNISSIKCDDKLKAFIYLAILHIKYNYNKKYFEPRHVNTTITEHLDRVIFKSNHTTGLENPLDSIEYNGCIRSLDQKINPTLKEVHDQEIRQEGIATEILRYLTQGSITEETKNIFKTTYFI